MHKPIYHRGYDSHGNGIAEICSKCSHDNVLVPVSFCRKAMKYLTAYDALDHLINQWLTSNNIQELHEYLGWSVEEYDNWFEKHDLPKWFIKEYGAIQDRN
jgi:hypothetical protein